MFNIVNSLAGNAPAQFFTFAASLLAVGNTSIQDASQIKNFQKLIT